MTALIAELDAKDRIRARRREAEEAAAAQRCAVLDRLMAGMMKSLVAADRAGTLAAAGPAIEAVRKSLGVKSLR